LKREVEYYNLLRTSHTHAHSHKHKHRHKKSDGKIPVAVIGGFLGAGKTTLVNHILSSISDAPVDVLVREYGEISIDDMLIHLPKRRLHVFPGVSMHFDRQIMLYGYMDQLYEEKSEKIDQLIMEASGLDEPEYMLKLFLLGNIRKQYQLASYITIVDAEYAHLNLDEYPIVQEQIAYADIILLNKTDLVESSEVDRVKRRLRGINGIADIYETSYCQIDPEDTLEVNGFEQITRIADEKKEGKEEPSMDPIKTVVLSATKPMNKGKVNQWLETVFQDQDMKLLRSKGFFCFAGSDYKFEFQGVRTSFHSKAEELWQEGEERKSTVVLIGENLNETKLKAGFEACV